MAATSTPAAPASADATQPAGSGAGVTSPAGSPAAVTPASLPPGHIDVEDMLGELPTEQAAEVNPEDPNADDASGTSTEVTPEETPEGEGAEHEEEEPPEIVEDAETGKRLVPADHLESALRQRAKAKTEAREAAARAAAAEAAAAELKAQLEAQLAKPVATADLPLARLVPKVDPNNEQHLTLLVDHAEAWIDWCERNPTGGTPSGEDGEEWTPDQVVDKKRWAQAVLKAIPETRQFQSEFAKERAKVRAENPRLFEVGTEEQKAHSSWQSKLLNFRTAADQDVIIAKLVKLERMEREEKDGIASYARVPKKPASAATAADKPKPKPVQVTTRPVGSVKPGSMGSSNKTLEQKLSGTAPVDVEDIIGG